MFSYRVQTSVIIRTVINHITLTNAEFAHKSIFSFAQKKWRVYRGATGSMCWVTCFRNDMDENLGVRQCSHLGTGCDVWRTECFPSTSITRFPTLLGAAGKICLQISLARKMNQSKWGKEKEELISDELQRGYSSAGNVFSIITYYCNLTGGSEGTEHKGDGWGESDYIPYTTPHLNQRWKTHLQLAMILLKMITSKLFSATYLSCWFECSQDLWQLSTFAVPLQVA